MTDLPRGWAHTTLGELGRYLNGRAFKKSEWSDRGRPIIRIQNLTGSSRTFNYFAGHADDRHVVRRGDLLMSWAATLGAFMWDGPEAVVNQHIFKVESLIDDRFHKYLLDSKLDELMRHTHGSGMVHITRSRFDEIAVVLPPPEEQQRIVAILDDHLSCLDAARDSLAVNQKRLRKMRRSAFDSVVWQGARSSMALGQLLARVEAGKSMGSRGRPAADDEWGIIKVSAMTWGSFRAGENKVIEAARADPRFEINRGDLLLSRANTSDYVGASVHVDDTRPRLLLSDKSLRLVPVPGVSTRWLHFALSSPRVRAQISARATGTKDSMRNISQRALSEVLIPKVTAAEQESDLARIDELLSAVSGLSLATAESDRRSRVLRRSLLSAAFSGRLSGHGSDMDRVEETTAT